jgi:hypothetical protein
MPPSTVVQDTLYRADGSRFNGVAFVEWKSFEASDHSVIANQTLTVPIVNGLLRVQVVPTTNASPGASYHVRYTSDGKSQFEETWSVPPSNTPLRLRDVRVGSGSVVTPPAQGTLIQESDVVSLPADLSVRPVKGPGYYPSRVAFVSSTGALESVNGSLGDCVRVDGTTGPCGTYFVDHEVPGGAVDGLNTVFTLSGAPSPAASLSLYRNGILQQQGSDFDISGRTVTFRTGAVPFGGDAMVASYRTEQAVSTTAFSTLFLSASAGPVRSMGRVGVPRQQRTVPAPGAPIAAEGGVQVLCGGTGNGSSGKCAIAPGLLRPGDRIEIRFDSTREGSGEFRMQVQWGDTILIERRAGARENILTGRAEVTVREGGAVWSAQNWGSELAPAHGAGSIGLRDDEPVVVELSARAEGAGAIVRLNYTAVRYPARLVR